MRRLACLVAALLLCLTGCRKEHQESSSPPPSPPPSSSAVESIPSVPENTPSHSQAPPESGTVSVPEASSSPPELLTLKLVVPEGYTLARIGMTLEEMGVCTADELIEAAQRTLDFPDFPLPNLPRPEANRCFWLEGYLFPDTYEIYADEAPGDILRRMLGQLERRITPELREAVTQSGYTFDEILALASIIEKESFGPEVMPLISSVLHNRLALGMRLQCDVTIAYVEGAIKPFITGDPDRFSAAYNTYKCDAIPAGAICNPCTEAIRAALYPAETDYLFFLTDKDKNYHFTSDWEEHRQNDETYVKNAS